MPGSPETVKYTHSQALEVANSLRELLLPFTTPDRCAIVGSLRRGEPYVSDVELLFVPRFGTRQMDMFQTEPQDLAGEFIETLLERGILAKRPNVRGIFTWGAQNKLAVHVASTIPVDLFATTEPKWWVSLVVRTGPKELNQYIAEKAHDMGMYFHAYGEGFTVQKSGREIICRSEEAVFTSVNLPAVPPQNRDNLVPRKRRDA